MILSASFDKDGEDPPRMAAPWKFTGGTIRQVRVNVSGRPYVDLEREAVAMMARE